MAKKKHDGEGAALPATLRRMMASSVDLQTQTALAERSGVGQSTIGRILRGDNIPQTDTLTDLARALGTTAGALLQEASGQSGRAIAPKPTAQSALIPLYSWVHAGTFSDGMKPVEYAESWLTCPRQCGPRTFALRLNGPTMEPHYGTGDIIYVDPDVAARDHKDVVVRLSYSSQVTVRRLVEVAKQRYLKALYPGRPAKLIPLSAAVWIAGVVIGRWSDR